MQQLKVPRVECETEFFHFLLVFLLWKRPSVSFWQFRNSYLKKFFFAINLSKKNKVYTELALFYKSPGNRYECNECTFFGKCTSSTCTSKLLTHQTEDILGTHDFTVLNQVTCYSLEITSLTLLQDQKISKYKQLFSWHLSLLLILHMTWRVSIHWFNSPVLTTVSPPVPACHPLSRPHYFN